MRRVLFFFFLVFLLNPTLIFAQRDSLRKAFLDAESWFLFEEYADALPLYESLLESDPGNYNLKYKLGICLLNDPYQKDKAIQYLLEASNNINPAYKQNNLKERGAPPDALYYLGNAYQVNELLESAIESYEEFLKGMDYGVYDEDLVLAQISSCKNAQRLKTMPVDLDLFLIDSLINTRYPDIRPVISGDGTKMAFVTKLPFYDGAFYTEKHEDGWSYPQMVTQMLGFDADAYPVALSYDGTEMILYYDDDYIGNLYYSKMEDGLWTPAVKLGENICTKYWESHASFSKDGLTLYFTSNRKGTHGGLDVYLSEKQNDGKWGPPVNLGTTINTRYNEESPYISEDGQTLYFSSYGHYNMGGYDIFYSRKNKDGTWAEPVNMGYPINTTDDDLFFQPYDKGNAAYYAIYSPIGIGQHDIYYMNIYSANNPRLYLVSGTLHTEDGSTDTSPVAIFIIDSESGDTLVYSSPTEEGEFAFQLKQGIYELHFLGEGYEELIRPLRITRESDKKGVNLEDDLVLALEAEEIEPVKEPEVFEGEESQIKLRETQVDAVAGTPVVIPVIAPKGSTLVIRTYQDSVLVSTDTLVTERRRTNVEIIPLPGNSEVELELTDKDGNIHRNRLMVVGSTIEGTDMPEATEQPPSDLQPDTQAESSLESPEGIILLAGSISGDDPEVLKQKLRENSDSPLNEYLEQLDIDAEGITSSEELMLHLQEASLTEGFTMEDVRDALIKADQEEKRAAVLGLLLQKSEGDLHTELLRLDSADVSFISEQELFEYLYDQAGTSEDSPVVDSLGVDSPGAYSAAEVDVLLANVLSDGDVDLLLQHMIENSGGALKAYLDQLDPEALGIQTSEDLLRHLESVAEEEGFTLEEIRRAMLDSLGKTLEVYQVYDKILQKSQGSTREILESLDLHGNKIYRVDQLIDLLYNELKTSGLSKKEIDQILYELFGDQYSASGAGKRKTSWPVLVVLTVAVAGLIWFLITWWRRREKGDKQGD